MCDTDTVCDTDRAFIVSLHTDQSVRVFKLNKKEDTGTVTANVAFDFPEVTSASSCKLSLSNVIET